MDLLVVNSVDIKVKDFSVMQNTISFEIIYRGDDSGTLNLEQPINNCQTMVAAIIDAIKNRIQKKNYRFDGALDDGSVKVIIRKEKEFKLQLSEFIERVLTAAYKTKEKQEGETYLHLLNSIIGKEFLYPST